MSELNNKACVFLEEIHISGDAMVELDHNIDDSPDCTGAMYLADVLEAFVKHVANDDKTSKSNCNIPLVVFSEAELKAKLDEQKEEHRQWLEGEGYEILAERL